MTLPTTQLEYADLANAVSLYLGWGIDYTAASANQKAIISDIINAGLQSFYNSYKWSFLYPTKSLVVWESVTTSDGIECSTAVYDAVAYTTVTADSAMFYPTMVGKTLTFSSTGDFTIYSYTSSTVVVVTGDASAANANSETMTITADGDYRLLDDFSGIVGDLFFTVNNGWKPLNHVNESYIMKRRMESDSTGTPTCYAIRPAEHDPTAGQRWDLMIHPYTNDDYTLYYKTSERQQDELDTTNKYHLGGAVHSQTVLAFCLAEAEDKMNDVVDGPRAKKAERLLRWSINIDADANTPDTLGYNGDRGSAKLNYGPAVDPSISVTYDGTQY